MRKLLLLAMLVVCAPAQAAETIATLPNESFIRSLGDMHLVQVRDEAGWHLMTIEDRELLPLHEIEPNRYPFDADIGTMRGGEPAVVFSRCARRRCDLYLQELTGAGVRKLRGANTAAAEGTPTLSRGRLVWVRKRRGRPPAVLTRRIGSRAPSRVLRVAPRHPKTYIDGLELEGGRLGVDLRWAVPDEAPHREVRLLVLGGRTRRIDHSVGALSGHDFGGLSFWGGWFGWHRSCSQDECPGEAYRYHLRSRVKQVARIPHLGGFALYGDGFVGVTSGSIVDDYECDTPCEVVLERSVRWPLDRG